MPFTSSPLLDALQAVNSLQLSKEVTCYTGQSTNDFVDRAVVIVCSALLLRDNEIKAFVAAFSRSELETRVHLLGLTMYGRQ